MKLGVVMDPIGSINYAKDSTLALLLEAQERSWQIYYFEKQDLYLRDGVAYGEARILNVFRDENIWYSFEAQTNIPLSELNVILMRKDPPFDNEYIYVTYLLEYAERSGVLVVNNPRALRDANEKFFACHFPQCSPPTLVTQSVKKLKEFLREQGEIVCKPLDAMGGVSIFRLRYGDVNENVILATLTQNGTQYIMAQQFIADIIQGDKRIIMINGKPIKYALARVPQKNDWRGNLAQGAKGVVQPLSERDLYICTQVGSELSERGLYFVGIDVIGNYLTEINVTSPTGIRELDAGANLNISATFFDFIEKQLA